MLLIRITRSLGISDITDLHCKSNMTGYSSYLIYAALIDTEIGDRSTHLVAFSVKKVSGRVPSFINFIFAIFFSFDQKIVRDFNFRTMEHALLRSHLK